MTKKVFHEFDPWDVLNSIGGQLNLIEKNMLEICKAHNGLQHHLNLLTNEVHRQQQEILELHKEIAELSQ